MSNSFNSKTEIKKSTSSGLSNGIKEGQAGFFSCSINLLKSILGSGMLLLPFGFGLVGAVPGIILLIIAAIASAYGLQLLAMSSEKIGGRLVTFTLLSEHTWPKLAPLFDFAIIIKCIGVAVSYLTIAGDFMPNVINGFWPNLASDSLLNQRWFWTVAITATISPIVCMRRMDSLKYTSFLGLISVFYLLSLSILLFIEKGKLQNIDLLVPFKIGSFKCFGILVFAFTCHQNLFPIKNEAKNNSSTNMLKIITLCVSISLGIYFIFAMVNFATFNMGNDLKPNIINSFPVKGYEFIIARLLYALLMMFSFPLQTFPCRSSTFSFIGHFWPALTDQYAEYIYWITTFVITAFTCLLAAIKPPLDLVLSLVGSTAGPIICFVLPAIFWIRLQSEWNASKIGAVILLIFAIFSTAFSLTGVVISQIYK